MIITKNTWSLILTVTSLGVVVIQTKVLKYSSTNVSTPLFTFNDVEFVKPDIILPLVFCLIILSAFIHSCHHFKDLSLQFKKTYKFNPSLVSLVTSGVAKVTGHSAAGVGPQYNAFSPSVIYKPINCGKFHMQNGRLSEDTIINFPLKLHYNIVFKSLLACISPRFWLGGYGPVIFGGIAVWLITI